LPIASLRFLYCSQQHKSPNWNRNEGEVLDWKKKQNKTSENPRIAFCLPRHKQNTWASAFRRGVDRSTVGCLCRNIWGRPVSPCKRGTRNTPDATQCSIPLGSQSPPCLRAAWFLDTMTEKKQKRKRKKIVKRRVYMGLKGLQSLRNFGKIKTVFFKIRHNTTVINFQSAKDRSFSYIGDLTQHRSIDDLWKNCSGETFVRVRFHRCS